LRVNLTDGGAEGLSCHTYDLEREESFETFTPTVGSDFLNGYKNTVCDWDKIPQSVLKPNQPIIKKRTKSFWTC